MDKVQRQVLQFHQTFGLTVGKSPEIREGELRARLLLEEAVETAVALVGSAKAHELIHREQTVLADWIRDHGSKEPNLIEAIDGLCDVDYIVKGSAIVLGIDLEPFADEVHRSNLSKVGGEVRADGKRLKGPNYSPPDIAGVLAREIEKQNGDIRLNFLVEETRRADALTETKPTREQRVSWVYGNCKLSNPNITREMCERAVDVADAEKVK